MSDHDLLRDLYVAAARPLYVSVETERYIHALAQTKDGTVREARMDVVGRTAMTGTTLLDFRLSIPPADAAARNGLMQHEEQKHARYPTFIRTERRTNERKEPGIEKTSELIAQALPSVQAHDQKRRPLVSRPEPKYDQGRPRKHAKRTWKHPGAAGQDDPGAERRLRFQGSQSVRRYHPPGTERKTKPAWPLPCTTAARSPGS